MNISMQFFYGFVCGLVFLFFAPRAVRLAKRLNKRLLTFRNFDVVNLRPRDYRSEFAAAYHDARYKSALLMVALYFEKAKKAHSTGRFALLSAVNEMKAIAQKWELAAATSGEKKLVREVFEQAMASLGDSISATNSVSSDADVKPESDDDRFNRARDIVDLLEEFRQEDDDYFERSPVHYVAEVFFQTYTMEDLTPVTNAEFDKIAQSHVESGGELFIGRSLHSPFICLDNAELPPLHGSASITLLILTGAQCTELSESHNVVFHVGTTPLPYELKK